MATRRWTREEMEREADALFDSLAATRRPDERPSPAAVVYFIQGENGGPIKIGYTFNLDARLAGLSSASPVPLRVLATQVGGRRLEAELHLRFRRHRLHGEWFAPAPDLLTLIEGLRR